MTSFANLKRDSDKNLDKLKAKVEQLNSSEGSDKSNNFWRPEVDKAGNGMATIRFLPTSAVDGDDSLPWVKIFEHGFQGPGGWLIDKCLTTKSQQCPVCEHNNKLWTSGIEANKDVVRKQKRKLSYIANVYIVSDPKHPENEGQVKLFKFGAKIFEKITSVMNPTFEDEQAFNPFDLWSGANFKLKITKVAGYQNYDKSEFASPAPLLDDDAKLEAIWKSEFSLKELTADKEFKSYDDLKARLEKVLGLNGEEPVAKTTVETLKSTPRKPEPEPELVTEDDDDLAYFAKLAEE
jgi:gp32 DNA binding protein like